MNRKQKFRMTKRILAAVLGAAVIILSLSALFEFPIGLWLTKDQQGDRLMEQKQFMEAAATYKDSHRQGIALYRAGEFKQSAAAFARMDDAESAFNRGNALMMMGKYDDSILSYDRALQFTPEWQAAKENRAIAIARRDRMATPDDDAGGTGGQLAADELVFDDRAKNSKQNEEIDVGQGDKLSDAEMQAIWLKQVQTRPGDFLRSKFAYQVAKRQSKDEEKATE